MENCRFYSYLKIPYPVDCTSWLYQIDDLRTAVETAKRFLTKEKIDKQRTGHSSMSPFMKANQENPKKSCEKGVSFGALKTIERYSDSIDKLTSLVNKLDMKLGRRETQYRTRINQGKNRWGSHRQDSYKPRDRSYSRDCGQYNNNRGRTNYNNDRNYKPNYRARSRSRNGYGNGIEEIVDLRIGKVIEETILGRTMVSKGIEIEV